MPKRFPTRLFACIYALALAGYTVFTLLYTFVLPRAAAPLTSASPQATPAISATPAPAASETAAATPYQSDTVYRDEHIEITLSQERLYDTEVYLADVRISDITYLKTALAKGSYGRNIKQTTSDMAEENNAILAINGDYYGFCDEGFVLRNGILYRDNGSGQALCIGQDGSFSLVEEATTDAASLDAWQLLSFGPALVEEGRLGVDQDSEVDQAMTSNPRTAIGEIEPLHYLFVVSDGRTNASEGLTLYQLATLLQDKGCQTAYNLDGGGSTTLWFCGEVINQPVSGGRGGERRVSDIVYIG